MEGIKMIAKTAGDINLETDRVQPVSAIAERLTGRRASPQTAWRWRIKGVRGVRLEAVFVNGCWCTTPAAFARFVREQTKAAIASCKAPDHEPTESRDESKTRQLEAAGLI